MSNGYCDLDFSDASDDCDTCEFVDVREVVARKVHKCSECGGEIVKGERYRVSAYRFDGEFGSDKQCYGCLEAAREFSYHIVGGSGLWLFFHEAWDSGAPVQACINRLSTVKAKEHMRQQWLKWDAERAERRKRLAERRRNGSPPSQPTPTTGSDQ